ncbi:MAG TPA: TetR/AcrR family transcriptional regulator [Acidimicrobiales bacterium]|nr:TetR/AcrR family transcriptional regulator [Acidimicrobiales bacterium]
MSTVASPGPRERLLASAQRLTAIEGVGVGVDAILEDASVARRSLYQHFGGKDELIAASLRESAHKDEERYRAALDSAGSDPRQRVLAVFDQLDETTSARAFRGCRYVSAELCLTDPDHPAHQVTRTYTERLHALFEKELADLGHSDPSAGAEQIVVLIDGVLVVGALRPGSHPALAVRPLVEQILYGAAGEEPSSAAR